MKNKLSPSLILLFFIACIQAQVPQIEREALIALYNATDGPNWNNNTNWNTASPVDTWFGITVTLGQVTSIDLNLTNDASGSNNLTGKIPDEIGNLQALITLDLSHNNLCGNLPDTLLNNFNLEFIQLNFNSLEGEIPDFTTLPNLSDLSIENNRFQFGDFETQFNAYNTILNTFTYNPQAKVDLEETISICNGMRIRMSTSVNGTENTYQWYKGVYPNGLLLAGKTDFELTYNFGNIANAGNYYCLIKSNIVTNLTLVREQVVVNVSDNDVYTGVVLYGLWVCDENDDGFYTFDSLNTQVIESQAGGGQTNISFSYFEPDGTPVDLTLPYTNSTPYLQTIIVRVSSNLSDCFAETSFDLTIRNSISPEDQVACDSYVLPDRTFGEYYTEANGNGTLLQPGDIITTSQTLYIFDNDACVIYGEDTSFEVTIHNTPILDQIPDQEVCSSYELPLLTTGNYFTQSNGTGTQLNSGDVITNSQTIYIYAETGTTPNCVAESSFDVTIISATDIDAIEDQTVCYGYTLPVLTNGDYFTQPNGTGNSLNAGDLITTSQTLYIYNQVGTPPNNCSVESNFTITINNNPDVDNLADSSACNSFTLNNLINGDYYTQPNGGGTLLNAGEVITTSQTLYIYREIGIAPNLCSNESSFNITINTGPNIDTITDQVTCDSYTLLPLTVGNYFTEPNGQGSTLSAGDTITSSQTIYIYAETGIIPDNCSAESNFSITINDTPILDDIPDVTSCGNYILPALSNGNYFTGPNGTGSILSEGDTITTSQTIYIYAEAPNSPDCYAENSFNITINDRPLVDKLNDITSCESYTLEPLINGNYYTQTNGNGVQLNAGEVITTSQTIYIFNQQGQIPNICNAESSFEINILPTEAFELTDDNLTLINQDVTVNINSNQNLEYAIDNGIFQTNNVFLNLSEGIHILTVRTEGGCFEKVITFIIKINKFIIPKFFTPNGDGYKDYWKVSDTKNIIKNIKIFNRFGKLIKTLTSSSNLSWDGSYNGIPLPTNDYWYSIELNDNNVIKGHFSLKR